MRQRKYKFVKLTSGKFFIGNVSKWPLFSYLPLSAFSYAPSLRYAIGIRLGASNLTLYRFRITKCTQSFILAGVKGYSGRIDLRFKGGVEKFGRIRQGRRKNRSPAR